MEKPLISVIVPAYKSEAYIENCINSILRQTYPHLEIIIINDASPDCVQELIDKFKAQDKRIVSIIHEKNRGIMATRKAGIEAATGAYIGFVDSDDEIDEDMYEVLLDHLVTHQTEISHCSHRVVYPNLEKTRDYNHQVTVFNQEEGLKALLDGSIIEPALWNKLYQAHLVKKLLDIPEITQYITHNEDTLFNAYLFSYAHQSVYIDTPKYSYIKREDSLSVGQKNNSHAIRSLYAVSNAILTLVDPNSIAYPYAKKRYYMALIRGAEPKNGKMDDETQALRKALRAELQKNMKPILQSDHMPLKMKCHAIGSAYVYPVYAGLYFFAKKLIKKRRGI